MRLLETPLFSFVMLSLNDKSFAFLHHSIILKTLFLQEIVHSVQVKEVMSLSEEEKIQASTDLAEAVYFLHGHSPVS
jgi:hypothetical protein